MKKVLLIIPVLLLAAVIYYGCQSESNITEPVSGRLMLTPDCPAAGSGAAGVAAFAELCECTDNPATTCNGDFTVEFLGKTTDGDLITFEYEVCEVVETNDLSHFVFSLNLDCLGDGFSLADLVDDVTWNGDPLTEYSIGLDPTTQLYGFKFNVGDDGCNTFSVTFDASKLAEGYTLGEGCGVAATKAGNQDIQREDRETPGYVCTTVPVCEEETEEEPCYQCETAFGGRTAGSGKAWWFVYDASGPAVQKIWAGKTMEAGTVEIVDGDLTITLNEGWMLQEFVMENCEVVLDEFGDPIPYDEPVKVQCYSAAELPTSRPAAGLFTTYKGTDLENIDVGECDYYVIHLDLIKEVECPE